MSGANPAALSQLEHPYRMIAFDWDGTAVVSRQEDAAPVRARVERLLGLGVFVVVITGTNFLNIDRQLSQAITGPFKQRLYICTNRGSEVYGFDAQSRPTLLAKRIATPRENQLLTEVADEVQRDVERRTRLTVRVISNRLNRRKIDLIPLPEWADPPKSDLPALLRAVEDRLTGGGMNGGLRDVFDLTVEVARAKGLTDARITSDVKHIEVGLTDKGDSIAWVMRHIAAPHGISSQSVLIAGDEFGPIGGLPGSDARMLQPEARGATIVSVGPEPNGVPSGVIHLGGGPACFRAVLDLQIDVSSRLSTPTETGASSVGREVLGPTFPATRNAHPSWDLVEENSEPAREDEIESLFAIANGFLGTRGSVHEHLPLAEPATFVAGIFSRGSDDNPELVIAPDWADFHVFVAGEELSVGTSTTLAHWRRLDMYRGTFEHAWRCRDRAGRITRLLFRRFVSLADRHALVQSVTLIPENYSARLRIESALDGRGATSEVALLPPSDLERVALTSGVSSAQTMGLVLDPYGPVRPGSVTFAGATVLQLIEKHELTCTRLTRDRWVAESWEWDSLVGQAHRIDKLVSAHSARESANPTDSAISHLKTLVQRGADRLFDAHVAAWAERWEATDVEIAGDEAAQRAIRFAGYHLIASANPNDEGVSIGARALTGDSYKGHVFWDTDIYINPFFAFTHPESARALLMYRYHALPGARKKAESFGYRGALYPWEAAITGEEAAPRFAIRLDGEILRVLTGEQEQHISADVAYAVWQYWLATGDEHFLREAGAEIILETARFWVSRVALGEDGFYHIPKVIGPDEYHETVDDDAYTNGMAQWNLLRSVEVVERLRASAPDRWRQLTERLELQDTEIDTWHTVADKLYLGFDPSTGLVEQFRGFFGLEEIDLAAYEPRTAPIDLILGHDRVARAQIIKQPDVVMLIYLLWDQFPAEVRSANFRYYAPRCAHGSSLSPSIHALVAARLGDRDLAERYFRQAAEIDLANNMGNAAGGVHVGALGGLWQAVVFGFVGLRARSDGLTFDPDIPARWLSTRFRLQWHGRQVKVKVASEPGELDVTLERGASLTIAVGEAPVRETTLMPGRRSRTRKIDGIWQSWQESAE